MKTNTQLAGTSSVAPVSRSAQGERLQVPVAGAGDHLGLKRTSMFGAAVMRSTRYCDIVASSDAPRTSSTTRLA